MGGAERLAGVSRTWSTCKMWRVGESVQAEKVPRPQLSSPDKEVLRPCQFSAWLVSPREGRGGASLARQALCSSVAGISVFFP